MKIAIILLILAVLLAIWCIATVNGFRKKEIRAQEGLSGIEVALAKRYDMLTKLLDAAKGYLTHETQLFTGTIQLRQGMNISQLNQAQQQMEDLSGKLFAVAPTRSSWSSSGASGTRRSTSRPPGGSTTPTPPAITPPSPCSPPASWPRAASPWNFSRPTPKSVKT